MIRFWKNQEPSIEIKQLNQVAHEKKDCLHVDSAWLPMQIWDSVAVTIKSYRGLSMMERFFIESIVRLQTCSAEDFEEIASMPKKIANQFLEFLEQHGLAREEKAGVYASMDEACQQVLNLDKFPIEIQEKWIFLWFPETDEFIVLKEPKRIHQQLNSMSEGQYPLKDHQIGVQRSHLLDKASADGRIYGEGISSILGFSEDLTKVSEQCPKYICEVSIPKEDVSQWEVELKGYPPKQRRRNNTQEEQQRQDNSPELVYRRLSVPYLPCMASTWRRQFSEAGVLIRKEIKNTIDFPRIDIDEHGIRTSLDDEATRQLMRLGLIQKESWLQVGIEDAIKFITPLSHSPSCEYANRVIAIDLAVQKILATATECMPDIMQNQPFGLSELVDRLWQLKEYKKVYEFREQEDFTV